jgi:hypothetical protein
MAQPAVAFIEREGPHGERVAILIYPLEVVRDLYAQITAGTAHGPTCPYCRTALVREPLATPLEFGESAVFRCNRCMRGAIIRIAAAAT